eukprot:37307-Eustigmatos_ZCMA.PRE.1
MLLATDIRTKCVQVYQFITKYYKPGVRVWLFGFSRGAFTVRSVAGMINNFGILCPTPKKSGMTPNEVREVEDNDWKRCGEVYTFYRSRDPMYHPKSKFSAKFKEVYSYRCMKPPKDPKPPI